MSELISDSRDPDEDLVRPAPVDEPPSKKVKFEGGQNSKAQRRTNNVFLHNCAREGGWTPTDETNFLDPETMVSLEKRKYDFSRAESMRNTLQDTWEALDKKPLDLREKLILAPLTTVGNLPFRRLCIKLGCEVTVGEMALASSLLSGKRSEHALLRRHKDEKIFGVQIAGGSIGTLLRCCQYIDDAKIDCDFVDLNMGCPIQGMTSRGAGAAMLDKAKLATDTFLGMSRLLTRAHVTCKVRLSVKDRTAPHKKGSAEFFIPKFVETGSLNTIFIHGRTAQQHYSKTADWERIGSVKSNCSLPLIGCGDVLTQEEYYQRVAQNPDGVMIGRGALIKPWIFREISERRTWDISSTERFDLLKDLVKFGHDHYGNDDRAVEKIRRGILEHLSFLHRYVPPPLWARHHEGAQNMNTRPTVTEGRDELETLMLSPSASDWVEISKRLLGPTPDGYTFVPKHKANSY